MSIWMALTKVVCVVGSIMAWASVASGGEAVPQVAAAGAAEFQGRPLAYWSAQAAATDRRETVEAIVQALTQALHNADRNVQVAAMDALVVLGPDARATAPVLTTRLDDLSPWLRSAAMDALVAIGKDAVPGVVQVFEQGNSGIRVRALMIFDAMGSNAEAALPALEKAAAKEAEPLKDRIVSTMTAIRGAADTGAASTAVPKSAAVATAAPLPAGDSGEWPGFHGPRRDAICTETGLLSDWPADGPPLLWRLDGLGRGYSTISIAGGKFFTMGDRKAADGTETQFALAYDLATRRELWATPIGPPHDDGGPRCTPTVNGQRVYVVGTAGDVRCLDAESGRIVWRRSLPNDFGGLMMSVWKFSESPLVDGPRVIVTPGGPDAMLVALDKATGETLWKCALPAVGDRGKDGAAYASAVVADIAGVRQYVQLVGRGLIGVEAETGRLLWSYNRIANTVANITSAIVRGDYVFTTTSYKTGAALLHIRRDGDRFAADEVYVVAAKNFENHHGGVVLVGEHLFGGHGQNRGLPTCVSLATGEVVWKERELANGSAAVLYADGNLILRYDRGPVALIAATADGCRPQGQFTPPLGDGPAWAHPVIHGGKLYLRHSDLLVCYDLRQQTR